MPTQLSELNLTLTQTREQRLLRVVQVGYGYTLKNTTDQSTINLGTGSGSGSGTQFQVEIDIVGDDVIVDDLLVKSVDAHDTFCAPDQAQRVERSLIVAQGVLDEDVGDDEIRVRVRVRRPSGQTSSANSDIEALTPIVKGKF